jgi:carbamoyl-phosphate synthase large subunit
MDNAMRFDYDTGQKNASILKESMKRPIKILFSCIGRRVSLINAFRDAARRLRTPLRVLGVDASPLSPALQLCDQAFLVPPVSEDGYLRDMLRIIRECRVEMLIPTVDLDLKILAANRGRFERLGCRVLVSRPEVIAICQDKRKAAEFWLKHGFDTPKTLSVAAALRRRKLEYPCFLKPWDGYASRGNAVAHNREELAFYGRRIPNCIVQEFVRGEEFTCDAFVDDQMRVRCVVPRRRLEVRSGEVSKARVHRDPEIMERVAQLVTVLGAGPGVITIQLIRGADGGIKFIEVNPRFGGGAPLSIRAGADFPRWILQELRGQSPRIGFDGFEDGLLMLRYDKEVWIHSAGGKMR